MSGADSFQFILNELVKEIRDINDTLALFGIYFLGKLTLKSFGKLYTCSRSYVVPLIFSNDEWLKSLGNWAIITGFIWNLIGFVLFRNKKYNTYFKGCTNDLGLGYCKELAKRGINLIIIDKDPHLLDQLASHLSKIAYNRVFIVW